MLAMTKMDPDRIYFQVFPPNASTTIKMEQAVTLIYTIQMEDFNLQNLSLSILKTSEINLESATTKTKSQL